MKFTDLSDHLHGLRYTLSGRPIGARMSAMDIWTCAEACSINGVASVKVKEADRSELPKPYHGLFVRYTSSEPGQDIVHVYVLASLPKHWKEFVIAKELMHCWSPNDTRVPTASEAKSLVVALTGPSKAYTAAAASDVGAVVAAAEVILPHRTLEKAFSAGKDAVEIAHEHGLHPDVAQMLCAIDMLPRRKNGSL